MSKVVYREEGFQNYQKERRKEDETGPLGTKDNPVCAKCQGRSSSPVSVTQTMRLGPYYLWDRIERRTVIAHRSESPHYIVITHTWGRWRKIPFSDVPVPGVLWPVPENTLFNVISLPSLLARVPFAARYIWFDLFCIPQNMSDPNFEARANRDCQSGYDF